MKKFLSDVLVDCNLTVSGTTSLGAATGVTVSDGDNSLALATTAWVTSHVSTNSIYSLSVPSGTTTIRLASANATDDVSITAAGSVAVSRVSDSEIRLTGTNNYLSSATFNTTNGVLTLGRQGLSDITVDLDNRFLTSESDTLDTVTSRDGVTTNTIGVGTVNVTGSTEGAELLTVDGTYGRLFTVTDDLSDSLFSVNTVAGLPAFEVFADNTIKIGAFANPITIDSSSNISIPGTITASGYNDSNWNTAFNDRITAAAVSGTSTKTLTLTQGDGSTITASWTDIEGTGADGYVSDVSLNGNSLDFTAVGSAFAGSIDLSEITTDLTGYATEQYVLDNSDDYGSWNLKTNGVQRTTVQSGGNLDIVAGTDISVSYGAGGVVTINSTATGSIDYVSDVALNGSSLDFTAVGSGFAGSIDLATLDIAPIQNVLGDGQTISTSYDTGTGEIMVTAILSSSIVENGTGLVDSHTVWSHLDSNLLNIAPIQNVVGDGQSITTSYDTGTGEIMVTPIFNNVPTENSNALVSSHGIWSYIDGLADNNNYITGLSFNTGNGVLTATRQGLGNLTVDLDGRYALVGTLLNYIRKDVSDSFTRLTNDTYDDTPGFLKGAISLRPGSEGGTTGIGFSTTVNVNTETGQDYGYLWWYDDNNNYAFGDGSGENAALILGIQNDSSTTSYGGTQDALVLESSANIFFNPGLSGIGTGGVGGPDFSQGNVYIGRADEAYVVYHQGNLVNVSQLTNDAGYLTSFSETDPVFTASAASGIVAGDITNWNNAFGWGDHSAEGYMLQPQWVQPITSGFGFHDDLGSAGDLNWAIGATDRGGIGQPGMNAFIIEKRTDGIEFTGLAQGTEVFTLDDSGNLGLSNNTPDHRLDVNGNIMTSGYLMIGNDTAARIALGSGTGNPVAQEIASLGTSVHIGAFIDFTIYNDDKSAMRSGTLQLVFNAGEVMFNEVSTMDIGDTTPCILTAVNVDEIVSVLFEAPDPSFHIKYQIRTI